jgi:hypothetical protein
LKTIQADRFALLRLDGDIYESTIVALENLYPKLSPGGYVIVDDYGISPPCKAAVTDYCNRNNFSVTIHDIDGSGAYWQKPL